MTQVHRRFTDDQVRKLFCCYQEGSMERSQIEEILKIGKTRFFAIFKKYCKDPKTYSLAYHRQSHRRLSRDAEQLIRRFLLEEKGFIDNPDFTITRFNYTAIQERLLEFDLKVSVPTIIDRAKALGCHQARPKKKAHSREVITTAVGALIQHDASHHRWSPYTQYKWTLISSLDDYSRKILYADFVEHETTWTHLQASETLMKRYGIPLQYYVDSLRVFRFVRSRDSVWYKTVLKTDDVDPQWKQAVKLLGVNVIHALSPQAKGKIERSYRWLQDRLVRIAAREKLTTLDEMRPVLHDEVYKHNHQRVHSTTREIPQIRFQRALKTGHSFFRPFSIPAPFSSSKDIFCLRETRTVNAYRRIDFYKTQIPMPRVPIGQTVNIHMTPDLSRDALHLRFWWENRLVHTLVLSLKQFPRVHF